MEILFRGKRVDNGEWVEGYYAKGATRHCILPHLASKIDVRAETVGQYLGIKDKNGKKWFSPDSIKDSGKEHYCNDLEECFYVKSEYDIHDGEFEIMDEGE